MTEDEMEEGRELCMRFALGHCLATGSTVRITRHLAAVMLPDVVALELIANRAIGSEADLERAGGRRAPDDMIPAQHEHRSAWLFLGGCGLIAEGDVVALPLEGLR